MPLGYASQMAATMESRRREMDAEFARRQTAQIRRLPPSMTQLLGEGLTGAPGLLYRLSVWKAAVQEGQEEGRRV